MKNLSYWTTWRKTVHEWFFCHYTVQKFQARQTRRISTSTHTRRRMYSWTRFLFVIISYTRHSCFTRKRYTITEKRHLTFWGFGVPWLPCCIFLHRIYWRKYTGEPFCVIFASRTDFDILSEDGVVPWQKPSSNVGSVHPEFLVWKIYTVKWQKQSLVYRREFGVNRTFFPPPKSLLQPCWLNQIGVWKINISVRT